MRRLGFALLLLLVFLAGLFGGAWLLRTDLAADAAQRWFAARGIAAQLTVEEVDFGGAVIRNLTLGRDRAFSVERMVLELAWDGPFSPRPIRLDLGDATLRADLTGQGPPLGELQGLLEGADTDPDGAAPDLPTLAAEIENLTILAETALGPAEARIDGRLTPAQSDSGTAVQAEVTLQGTTPVAVFGGSIEASGTMRGLATLSADLRFAAEAQGLDGRVLADLDELAGTPLGSATIDLTAGPRAATLLAPLLPRPPVWEELRLTLELQGQFPRQLPTERPHPRTLLAWTESGAWAAAMTFTAERLAWPGLLSGGQVLLALDLKQEDGILTVLPADTAEIGASALAPGPLEGLGLPDDLVQQLAAGASLRLLTQDRTAPILTAQRRGSGLMVRPSLRLVLESGPSSAATSLRGNLSLDTNGGIEEIDLSEFSISFSDWTLGGHHLVSAGAAGRLAGPLDGLAGVLDIAAEAVPAVPGGRLETLRLAWPADLAADMTRGDLRIGGPLTAVGRDFALDGLRLDTLTADLSADLAVDFERREETVRFGAPGSLTAETLRLDGRRVDRLRADLETNSLAWSPVSGVTHILEALWTPLDLRVSRNGESLLEAEVSLGRWRIAGGFGMDGAAPDAGALGYVGELAVQEGRIALADPALHLSGISLAGPLPPAPDQAWDLRGRLTHDADMPLLPPLALAGGLEPMAGGYALAVTGQGLEGGVSAVLRAEVDPQAPSVEATLTLAPVAFAPSGLQPGDLTPLLEGLGNASGRLGATIDLRWSGADATSDPTAEAEIVLQDVGFDYDGIVTVSGLDGVLAFASLIPPRAPPPQILTAERIDAGVALTDLRAEVAVVPGREESPRLEILSAQAQALGGRLSLREGSVDPMAGRQEAVIVLEGIEVGQLLALVDAPDIQATGRISGEIPIALEGETLTVTGGRLSAEEPGLLQLTSQAAKEALAQGGASVELMMQALENFQYEELSVGLDKPAEGTTILTVKLLGQNPDVLDGQPFDINVRVETDLGPILLALSQALQLTEGLVERLWRAQR